ncbi:MAG: MATE family efflux transporter [Eubacteriales bacterium]|nr:MATE family efflux transporter [Eubacteriales bacterium]
MKQAVQKRKLDMLNGSLWNKIPQFALPVAATAILEQLFNASDIAVVGNFSGAASTIAVAAVGANSFVISLVVNFFIGIALGANVVIANAIGREDEDDVHRAVHTAVVVSVLGGVLVTIFGELAAGTVLRSLNAPEEVLPYALLYLRIYLLGMPVILLYNFEAAIFRSIGDTRVPLQTLAFSGILNVLLNLFFVIVLHMTVNGVATATVISNAISSVLLFVRLRRSDKAIHLDWKELRIDRKSLQKILQIGFPAGIQSAVFSISNIVIQSAINSLGTVVMAASSAAFNIEVVAYDVLNSFSQACTTFVGQNYGAGKLDRCRKTLVLCLVEDALASGIAILLVLGSGHFLLSLFNRDPEVIALGYTRLMTVFTAYFFSMLYEVMSGYLRGFGISLVPALLTMLGVCGVRILWIATAFPRNRTFQTILLAYPLSLAATAVLILLALLIYHPSRRTKGETV